MACGGHIEKIDMGGGLLSEDFFASIFFIVFNSFFNQFFISVVNIFDEQIWK